jgi:hypothetical protein
MLVACGWLTTGTLAHKPVTSPYTFYEDVLPITRARCGACHAPDGIAPMSLLSHDAAVPWGESMRLELVAGHMPPGSDVSPRGRFLQEPPLTARELNVLLTWATGGTPAGDPARAAAVAPPPPRTAASPPSQVLALPRVELARGEAARVTEHILPLGSRPRRVTAVDLRPGTRSIVRSARLVVRQTDATGRVAERVVALWVPGVGVERLHDRAGWTVEAGAELVVRIVYRKRWDREREPAADDSTVALYEVAADPWTEVDALEAVAPPAAPEGRLVSAVRVDRPLMLLALWPDTALAGADVLVEVVSGNTRSTLAAFAARAGWERRLRLARPELLPQGSRLEVTATWTPAAAVPKPGARLAGFDVMPAD